MRGIGPAVFFTLLGLLQPTKSLDRLPTVEQFNRSYKQIMDRLDGMQVAMRDLARQTMLQQFAVEERVRSDGNSGVKLTRGTNKGSDNFYEATHIGKAFNSIHDHSNNDRTLGMGEIIAVLNGVEFRTRHNDYKLKMPSTTSSEYHATEDVPFPDVPPEVLAKTTVEEQTEEMRQWFKAFSEQNSTVRDYRKYFKPVLCYMEGAWTLDKKLEEPFESDRHQIDASSWFELQDLVRYSSYTGTKSRLENFAYLPTAIMSVNETTGVPNYAQWNYRIICSPIQEDIPTSYLKKSEDLATLVGRKDMTEEKLQKSRGQRFHFFEFDEPMSTKSSLIDRIFYAIPGKDNIPGFLNQSSFGEDIFTADESEPLNTGYYHRFFTFAKPGAMGLKLVSRGYNDANCWVAETTQKRVAPIGLKVCKKVRGGRKKNKVCEMMYTRFSYAIPLEIIYTTPLLSWNPHNLKIHEKKGQAKAGGRNGMSKPLDGVDRGNYYMTPIELFAGGRRTDKDEADTVRRAVKVLDQNGQVRQTTASGTRIMLPAIDGVGAVRLRYPIAPVHGEGSSVWKELNAVKTVVSAQGEKLSNVVHFQMSPSSRGAAEGHTHDFVISRETYNKVVNLGLTADVTTTENNGHSHQLTIRYNTRRRRFEYLRCDSRSVCADGHAKVLYELK